MFKELTFFVPGHPAPGGSKRAFPIRKGGQLTGRVAIVDAGGERTKNWRQAVTHFAFEAMKSKNMTPTDNPVSLSLTFFMPRPKYHYGKQGLKKDAPFYHTIAPDCTKLTRSTEDSMIGIVYRDDRKVVSQGISKSYGEQPGCLITVIEV